MGNHKEDIVLNVIDTGRHPIILRLSWLKAHSSIMDWHENRIVFAHAHYATNCFDIASDVFAKASEIPEMIDKEADMFCINADISGVDTKTTFSIAIGQKHIEGEKPIEKLILKEYHDFLNIFSKEVTTKLPLSREYYLAINLKEGAKLPKPARIYPMFDAKLKNLKQWIDEMLAKGFI